MPHMYQNNSRFILILKKRAWRLTQVHGVNGRVEYVFLVGSLPNIWVAFSLRVKKFIFGTNQKLFFSHHNDVFDCNATLGWLFFTKYIIVRYFMCMASLHATYFHFRARNKTWKVADDDLLVDVEAKQAIVSFNSSFALELGFLSTFFSK